MPSTKRADLLRLQLRMSEEARKIGGRIRELRKALPGEPSQRELAAQLPGNVQGAEWSRWETGRHAPQSDTLEEIAKLLDTTTADLRWGPLAERKQPREGDLDELNSERGGSDPDRRIDELHDEVAELRSDLSEVRSDLQLVLSLLRRGERGQGGADS